MTYFNKCTDSKISGHIRQDLDGITGAIDAVAVVSVSIFSFFANGINAIGPPLRFLPQIQKKKIDKDLS